MRRILLAIVIAAATTAFGFCEESKYDVSVWGGYATVDMSDVNNLVNTTLGTTASVTKITNGFIFGAEGLYRIYDSIMVGPRIGYLITNQGKADISSVLAATTVNVDSSLLPVLVGGTYMKDLSEKFSLGAGLFIGWAFAYATTELKVNSNFPSIVASSDNKVNYAGSGFASDIFVRGQYNATKSFGVSLDIGYRYAPIPEVKATGDVPGLGVSKNDKLTNINGSTVKVDFSGLLLAVGLHYRFGM